MRKPVVKAVLDVGSSRTRLVAARIGAKSGVFEIVGYGISTAGKLKAGVVTNIPAVSEAIRQVREMGEKQTRLLLNSVSVALSGEHILGVNSEGHSTIHNRHIQENDVTRAMMRARQIASRDGHRPLHILEQQFIIDGRQSVSDPRGMVGDRLDVRAHIISARRAIMANLEQCIHNAGIHIENPVYAGLASAYAASSPEERDLGICTVDLGAGTADIMLWWHNRPMHAATLPIGGEQISSALASFLRIPRQTAEMLKCQYGTLSSKHNLSSRIPLPSTGHFPDRYIASSDVIGQISNSYQQLFTQIGKEFQRIGLRKILDGGIIFTGGAAQMPGLAEMASEFFDCTVRVFVPPAIEGLDKHLQNDAGMTTALGLLYLLYEPIDDYIWAREEKEGIIPSISNFLKRYF